MLYTEDFCMHHYIRFSQIGSHIILHSMNIWQRKTTANHWWFPNFTIQTLTLSCDIYKESKQAGNCWSFTHQKFLMRNLSKFSSVKNSCYTVWWPCDTQYWTITRQIQRRIHTFHRLLKINIFNLLFIGYYKFCYSPHQSQQSWYWLLFG